jgi:hypothetical protein
LHPTHGIYPEFDPRKQISPDDSWIFVFTNPGVWEYHDHLNSVFKGKIIVKDLNESLEDILTCDGEAKQKCSADLIRKYLKEGDIEGALNLVSSATREDPTGSIDCHSLVHLIGEEAFQYFLTRHDFKISDKASLCNFGFYHGFMEALLVSGGDLKQASDFCDYVDKQLSSESAQTGLQCYHGIGHGSVGMHDPSVWGDETKMIPPALKLCEDSSKNKDQLYRCTSGVYNGIGNFYTKGEYELDLREGDPLWICQFQPEEYKESCYGNIAQPVLGLLTGGDLSKAANFVLQIKDTKYIKPTMRYVSEVFASKSVSKEDFNYEIETCKSLREDLRTDCIVGFVIGLVDFGSRKLEHDQAFKFCRSSLLSAGEREECFKIALKALAGVNSKDGLKVICGLVEDQYKKYCRDN